MSKNNETVAKAKKEIEAAKAESDINAVKARLDKISNMLDAVQI
ncbi:hypothetical protein [Halovulum marinum]|nr:hypothetical protein [Halovulum marinum]